MLRLPMATLRRSDENAPMELPAKCAPSTPLSSAPTMTPPPSSSSTSAPATETTASTVATSAAVTAIGSPSVERLLSPVPQPHFDDPDADDDAAHRYQAHGLDARLEGGGDAHDAGANAASVLAADKENVMPGDAAAAGRSSGHGGEEHRRSRAAVLRDREGHFDAADETELWDALNGDLVRCGLAPVPITLLVDPFGICDPPLLVLDAAATRALRIQLADLLARSRCAESPTAAQQARVATVAARASIDDHVAVTIVEAPTKAEVLADAVAADRTDALQHALEASEREVARLRHAEKAALARREADRREWAQERAELLAQQQQAQKRAALLESRCERQEAELGELEVRRSARERAPFPHLVLAACGQWGGRSCWQRRR